MLMLRLCLVFGMCSVALPTPTTAVNDNGRRVSYWVSAKTVADAQQLVQTIKTEGGLKVASNFFIYCGDSVHPNGSFVANYTNPVCDTFDAGVKAMGMGVEHAFSADLGGLRLLFNNAALANATVAQMAALVKAKGLTGLSWDVEPKGSTYKDALGFGGFNRLLQNALHPLGARVTTYSNSYSAIIGDIADYVGHVDAVMTGETYNGKSYTEWLGNYEKVQECFTKSCASSDTNVNVNASAITIAISKSTPDKNTLHSALPNKMVPSMLASTERGDWNCDDAGMAQRVQRILQDNATELALFVLDVSGSCIQTWFPHARNFLSATTQVN